MPVFRPDIIVVPSQYYVIGEADRARSSLIRSSEVELRLESMKVEPEPLMNALNGFYAGEKVKNPSTPIDSTIKKT